MAITFKKKPNKQKNQTKTKQNHTHFDSDCHPLKYQTNFLLNYKWTVDYSWGFLTPDQNIVAISHFKVELKAKWSCFVWD